MGSTFRFMHCADLHLGSRFRGVDSRDPALAERMRRSIFDSFEKIVDTAVREKADMLVISGDLYDDGNELPSTRMWLARQLERLSIPVFISRGNHDSAMTWDDSISYPDNVHEFPSEPESITINDDIEVVGVSYAVNHETRNLAGMIKGRQDRFTIACVHCDLDSYSEGYSYAPCSESDLRGSGVDYWALGHIHKREVVSDSPYIVYPGNIQGRNRKESGSKGAYLVTVSDRRVTSLDFIPTQSLIWKDVEVDIAGKSLNDAISEIRSKANRSSIVRLIFTGSGDLDRMLRMRTEDIRKAISEDVGCIISSVVVETTPLIDLAARSESKDMTGSIIRAGARLHTLSKEQIVDIICKNKVAARYRDRYMAIPEEELRSIIDDAMKGVIARMEAE